MNTAGTPHRESGAAAEPRRERRTLEDRARTFTIGAAYGFVAGVCALALLFWQFRLGPPVTPTTDAQRPPQHQDIDPSASGIGSPPPAATTGRRPEVVHPTLAAPAGEALESRDLLLPVDGIRPEQLTRQFNDPRGGRRHEAIDILAPTGTPVRAVESGRIARLFSSRAGGITIYQFDPSEEYCYYYAHLDRYADGLRENTQVEKGQVIGYVGTSGNAPKNTPHLHFAVYKLNAQKRWWEGTPIDPYDLLR